MGIAVGAGITYILRRGPSGRRPISPVLDGTGRGLAWMGKQAAVAGRAGASWAGEHGAELWDRLPRDEIRRSVEQRVSRAKDAIDDAVETEIRSLRKAVRRRRKQMGL